LTDKINRHYTLLQAQLDDLGSELGTSWIPGIPGIRDTSILGKLVLMGFWQVEIDETLSFNTVAQ